VLTPETGLSKSEAVGNFQVEEMFALSNPLFLTLMTLFDRAKPLEVEGYFRSRRCRIPDNR